MHVLGQVFHTVTISICRETPTPNIRKHTLSIKDRAFLESREFTFYSAFRFRRPQKRRLVFLPENDFFFFTYYGNSKTGLLGLRSDHGSISIFLDQTEDSRQFAIQRNIPVLGQSLWAGQINRHLLVFIL